MSTDKDIELKKAFEQPRAKKTAAEPGAVPERIKNHAPAPVLRPEGSWRAHADAVDQKIREKQEAAQARSTWAQRQEQRRQQEQKQDRRNSLGFRFGRSAKRD